MAVDTSKIILPEPPVREPFITNNRLNMIWQRWLEEITASLFNAATDISNIDNEIPKQLSDLDPRPYADLQGKPNSLTLNAVTDVSDPITLDVATDISAPITLDVVTDVTQDPGTKDITVSKTSITFTEGTLSKTSVTYTEGTLTKSLITYLEG